MTAGGGLQTVAINAQVGNIFGYIDNFQSVAFTTLTGISVASRTTLGSAQALFDKKSVFYEFAPDSQIFGAITDVAEPTSPLHLFVGSRGGAATALQITGLTDAASTTLSVRVVPVN